MLHAQGIAEALDGFGGTPEVAELPVTVQINRMDNDVIMRMPFIGMCCHQKSMLAMGEAAG